MSNSRSKQQVSHTTHFQGNGVPSHQNTFYGIFPELVEIRKSAKNENCLEKVKESKSGL